MPNEITIQDMQEFVTGTVRECANILPDELQVMVLLFTKGDGPCVFATNADREKSKAMLRAAADQAVGNRIVRPV
jgi:hypothetical protein